ncbi:BnaC01g28580D [Brassica napus]|uniref:BnaC01g28580D protein n=1 Tax=Brassica napus TaxID=3708 RepID=A0A078HBD3_BRANA|nr:BnaC01g28580D [Brassica napus]
MNGTETEVPLRRWNSLSFVKSTRSKTALKKFSKRSFDDGSTGCVFSIQTPLMDEIFGPPFALRSAKTTGTILLKTALSSSVEEALRKERISLKNEEPSMRISPGPEAAKINIYVLVDSSILYHHSDYIFHWRLTIYCDFVIHRFIPTGRANHYMSSLKAGSIVKFDRFEVARCSSIDCEHKPRTPKCGWVNPFYYQKKKKKIIENRN